MSLRSWYSVGAPEVLSWTPSRGRRKGGARPTQPALTSPLRIGVFGRGLNGAVARRRMQGGQLIGGAQAPVPVFLPHTDFFQFQARAGRAAAARGAG